jgi:hypothetical protein
MQTDVACAVAEMYLSFHAAVTHAASNNDMLCVCSPTPSLQWSWSVQIQGRPSEGAQGTIQRVLCQLYECADTKLSQQRSARRCSTSSVRLLLRSTLKGNIIYEALLQQHVYQFTCGASADCCV